MAYTEATWPKAVDIQTAVERLQHQFEAISWDALLSINRMGLTAEEIKEVQAIETKYSKASDKCDKFLKGIIDVKALKQYLVDNELENYLEKFVM